MTKYLKRELASTVQQALATLPVVVVTGMRQTGKTTLLREDPTLRSRRYVTLDDFGTLEAARRDPVALLEGDEPLAVDEAQRSPELLVAVKRAVDRRRVPGQFVLSGSANFGLLRGVSETLAGRALYLRLRPFTRRERTRRVSSSPWIVRFLERGECPRSTSDDRLREEEILDGGMPPIAVGQAKRRDLWFLGYEQTYLERDLRDLAQVADLVSFRNVMRLAAARTGQVLNRSELARDAALPSSTVARYLNLLETSFVTTTLAPHLRSRTTRLIKSPKLFVSDSGLAAHLTGVQDLKAPDEPFRGPLLETWVHQNLAGILEAHLPGSELTYWSVQGRHEVDFVASSGRRSVAIEVKAAARFTDRDLRGLRAFREKTRQCVGGVLAYNGRESVSLGDGLHAVPITTIVS